jgi:hypothetical protein
MLTALTFSLPFSLTFSFSPPFSRTYSDVLVPLFAHGVTQLRPTAIVHAVRDPMAVLRVATPHGVQTPLHSVPYPIP